MFNPIVSSGGITINLKQLVYSLKKYIPAEESDDSVGFEVLVFTMRDHSVIEVRDKEVIEQLVRQCEMRGYHV